MTEIFIIHPDGTIKSIRQEEDISLEQYYELLDCRTIELIHDTALRDYEMICDEEALIRTDKEPSINKIATMYVGGHELPGATTDWGSLFTPITGTVALQPKGTLK